MGYIIWSNYRTILSYLSLNLSSTYNSSPSWRRPVPCMKSRRPWRSWHIWRPRALTPNLGPPWSTTWGRKPKKTCGKLMDMLDVSENMSWSIWWWNLMKFGKLNYISGRFQIMNHLRQLHQGSHRGVLPIGGLWIIYSESNWCFGLSACQCQPLIYKAQCPKNMIGIEKRRHYPKKWDMSTGQSAQPIIQGSTGSQLIFEWEFPPYQMIGTGGTHNLCLVSCHGAVLIVERLESTPWAQSLDTSYERRKNSLGSAVESEGETGELPDSTIGLLMFW